MNVDSPDRFRCPPKEADRFSLPDIRDHDKEEDFKAGQGFIYYQHLRKAGGTGFCEMAGRQVEGRRCCLFFCDEGAEISLFLKGKSWSCGREEPFTTLTPLLPTFRTHQRRVFFCSISGENDIQYFGSLSGEGGGGGLTAR